MSLGWALLRELWGASGAALLASVKSRVPGPVGAIATSPVQSLGATVGHVLSTAPAAGQRGIAGAARSALHLP